MTGPAVEREMKQSDARIFFLLSPLANPIGLCYSDSNLSDREGLDRSGEPTYLFLRALVSRNDPLGTGIAYFFLALKVEPWNPSSWY